MGIMGSISASSDTCNLLGDRSTREVINYIVTKAKCRHQTKFTCNGTLRQVFICLSYIPPSLRLHTVYVHVLIHTGKGGSGES
jgi:hypothetical protein